eukprot:EG_transcript_13608
MVRQAVTLRPNESIGPLSERFVPPTAPGDFTGEAQFAPRPLMKAGARSHGRALLVQQRFQGLGLPASAAGSTVWTAITPPDAPPRRSIAVPKQAAGRLGSHPLVQTLCVAMEEGPGDGGPAEGTFGGDEYAELLITPKRRAKQRPLRSVLAASAVTAGVITVSIPSTIPELVAAAAEAPAVPSHEERSRSPSENGDAPGGAGSKKVRPPETYLCPLVPALPDVRRPKPLPTATETELRQLMTHRTAERSGTPPTAKLDRAAIYQQAMGYAEQLQRAQQTYVHHSITAQGDPSSQSPSAADLSCGVGEDGRPGSPPPLSTIDTRPIPGRPLSLEEESATQIQMPSEQCIDPKGPGQGCDWGTGPETAPEFIFSPFNPDFHHVRTPPELPFVLGVIAEHRGARRVPDSSGSGSLSPTDSPT